MSILTSLTISNSTLYLSTVSFGASVRNHSALLGLDQDDHTQYLNNARGDARYHTKLVGEIKMFAGTSAPTGWAICNGSAVSRTTYSALFAVISTTFGAGDNTTTFNLPDMRDRNPIGASGTNALGSFGGSDEVTLTADNMPEHSHGLVVGDQVTSPTTLLANTTLPSATNKYLSQSGGGPGSATIWADGHTNPFTTDDGNTSTVGLAEPVPVETRDKYLAVSFIIYTGV